MIGGMFNGLATVSLRYMTLAGIGDPADLVLSRPCPDGNPPLDSPTPLEFPCFLDLISVPSSLAGCTGSSAVPVRFTERGEEITGVDGGRIDC